MSYSLYFVNPEMGYFERSETFDALNDEVAVSISERKAGRQPMELWCGGRLVRRLEARTVTAPVPARAEAAA